MQRNYEDSIKENLMLEEIRKLLGLTIEQFVYEMAWPNTKYYDYIKNGRKDPTTKLRKATHPTIYKIFTGINKAINAYPHWEDKKQEITQIVVKHLLPST